MIRHWVLSLAMAMILAACGSPGDLPASETTRPSAPSSIPSTSAPDIQGGSFPLCGETPYPAAPDEWYRDTPIYVGNEMPVEQVREFASSLDGYQNIWIDRDHNGWVTVGFHGVDVEQHQQALEAEFPDAGVVAVEMPRSLNELETMRATIHAELPDEMHAMNIYEVPGEIEVWVGVLEPDRIATVEAVAGDAPVCLSGIDPATAPSQGPQADFGDNWNLVAVVDSMLPEEVDVIATPQRLSEIAGRLGVPGELPQVDFESHIVLAIPVIYSGSCPETRFDGFEVVDDLVTPLVVHTSLAEACTDDANPRTYLIALERSALPETPFRIWQGDYWMSEVVVTADLRVLGSTPDASEIERREVEPPRTATEMPFVMEVGFPWNITIDVSCGLDYLGSINSVGWYREDSAAEIPPEWEAEVVDGLLDIDVLITEGPEPTLTASAGALDVRYLPGSDEGAPCR